MPFVSQRRTLISHLKDALIAPITLVLVGIVSHWWVLMIGALCVAVCLVLGGGHLNLAWDPRETLLIFVGVYVVISFAALLLSLSEYLFGQRWEQVWIPDPRCLEVSQKLVGRLIAQDFSGAFELLSPEYRTRLTLDELIAAFNGGMSKVRRS